MDNETQQELDRLEEELLAELEQEPLTEEELLASLDLEGVFDDLADPVEVSDQDVYINSPNDYSDELQEFADHGGEDAPPHYFSSKLTLGLSITAGALCAGIVGLLVYWLVNFL